MKKALFLLAAVATGASALAQGTITFYNNGIARPFTETGGVRTYTYNPASNGAQTMNPRPLVSTDGTTYRAGIFRPDGTGAGAGFTAGLFLTSDLNTPIVTTPFRSNNTFEVFANNQTISVPGAAVGSSQNFTVRVWETAAGSYAASAMRGEQSFTSQPLGGPVAGNPDAAAASLLGFNGFTLVPEPSTYALGIAGLGALAMMRRRK